MKVLKRIHESHNKQRNKVASVFYFPIGSFY